MKLNFEKGYVNWKILEFLVSSVENYNKAKVIFLRMEKKAEDIRLRIKKKKELEERKRLIFTQDYKKYTPQDLV